MTRLLALACLLGLPAAALAGDGAIDPMTTGSVKKSRPVLISRDSAYERNREKFLKAKRRKERGRACKTANLDGLVDRSIKASLRQKVGQILIAGFKGRTHDHPGFQEMLGLAGKGHLGGLLFLKRNVGDEDQLRKMIVRFNRVSEPRFGIPIISVDQEGGYISRLGPRVGVAPMHTAARVARRMSPDEAERAYKRMAYSLAELGFNFNFGPVVDINLNPKNPIIGRLGRSFSNRPSKVTAYARAFIAAHRSVGVWTSLKHFPGHGSSRHDSHKRPVDVSGTWSARLELKPYKDLAKSCDIDSVMMGHIQIDKGGLPATINKALIDKRLRGTIGFNGLVVTDDLRMDALRPYAKYFSERAKRALLAGNDLLILSSKKTDGPELITKFIDALVRKAKADPALRQRIDDAFYRVMAFRKSLSSVSRPRDFRTGKASNLTTDIIETKGDPEDWQIALRKLADVHRKKLEGSARTD